MDAEFKIMLLHLAKGIADQELVAMKFMASGDIGKRRLEECTTVYDFWQALEQKELMSPTNVSYLKKMLTEALRDRNDLLRTVGNYEEKLCIQERSVTSTSLGLPTTTDASSGMADEIDYISGTIGRDWKQLARKMKISESAITGIVEKHSGNLREQAIAMLSLWLKHKTDSAAALSELITLLKAIERKDMADDLQHRRHLVQP